MKVVYKTVVLWLQLKFEGMSQNQVMVLKFCNVYTDLSTTYSKNKCTWFKL